MARNNITNGTIVNATTDKAQEPSEFAIVKVQSGMAVSTFLFDDDVSALAFFEASKNIHGMGKGHSKTACFLKGHPTMATWDF